ncbi:MAG: CsgG/HfaB family protein [bacterium]
MRRLWLSMSLPLMTLIIILVPLSRAKQIVTEEERAWAKKTIEKEKGIESKSAPNTLAVLYFVNKTGQKSLDPIQKGISLMLISDLSKIKGIHVIERVKLQALMEEIDLKTSGLVDPDTGPRLGRLLKAKWVLGGWIEEKEPSVLQIQSNFLEVPTHAIVKKASYEGTLSELFRIEKELLFDIINLLKIELAPSEEETLRRPLSTNPEAIMALFRAVEASDLKDYKRSTALYKEALGEDSAMDIAQESLLEIEIHDPWQKKSRNLLHTLRDRTSLTDQLEFDDSLEEGLPSEPDSVMPTNKGGYWETEVVK